MHVVESWLQAAVTASFVTLAGCLQLANKECCLDRALPRKLLQRPGIVSPYLRKISTERMESKRDQVVPIARKAEQLSQQR